MKKKILFVCYNGQTQYFKKVLKKLSTEVIVKVTSKKSLSFLNDHWDIIFCITEPYEVMNLVGSKDWGKNYKFLDEVHRLYPDKKIYRLGYISKKGETVPFIDLDCQPNILRDRIVETLN